MACLLPIYNLNYMYNSISIKSKAHTYRMRNVGQIQGTLYI